MGPEFKEDIPYNHIEWTLTKGRVYRLLLNVNKANLLYKRFEYISLDNEKGDTSIPE